MPSRAIVIGGSGQIGSWLLRVLHERGHHAIGTYATVAYPGLVHLDAADLATSAAWLRAQKPDVVFYPAGFTWVDGCERDPAKARSANLEQPLNLARVAAESGARFVYFSTDYVFDGAAGPYTEESPVNPSPSMAGPNTRPSWRWPTPWAICISTPGPPGSSAPNARGRTSPISSPRPFRAAKVWSARPTRSPTRATAPDVARAVVGLVEAGQSGLIHVAGPEVMDRVQFAQGPGRRLRSRPVPDRRQVDRRTRTRRPPSALRRPALAPPRSPPAGGHASPGGVHGRFPRQARIDRRAGGPTPSPRVAGGRHAAGTKDLVIS